MIILLSGAIYHLVEFVIVSGLDILTVSDKLSAFSLCSFKACCNASISALCSLTASSTAWRDSVLRCSARSLWSQPKSCLIMLKYIIHKENGITIKLHVWEKALKRQMFYLFCFSLSSSLCRSLVRLSAWVFSSSRAPLHASHCLSFSSNSSFRDSSSTTCSSSMLHVVFSVSMFWEHKLKDHSHGLSVKCYHSHNFL